MTKMIANTLLIVYSIFLISIFGCQKDEIENPIQGNSSAVFNPQLTYGTMTDQDGITYKTVTIGSQTWMAENLRTSKYRNGDKIPVTSSNSSWASSRSGTYCVFNNSFDADFIATYGFLYNWYAIADSRNIAPEGWHVPTDAEWDILIEFLGSSNVSGGKMKESGMLHWNSPNSGATNESGFTALPGGLRHYDGSFGMLKEHGSWWSTTPTSNGEVWIRDIYFQNTNIGRYEFAKTSGFSVRCIKD